MLMIAKDLTKREVACPTKDGREMVSDHIYKSEFADKISGEIIVFEPLIDVFEAVRAAAGCPISIFSGYRTKEHQAQLYQQDMDENNGTPTKLVASPDFAPHTYGAAMDLETPFGRDPFVLLIRKVCKALSVPVRLGYLHYNGFVHVDVMPMLFSPYTPAINPVPLSWVAGMVW